VVDVKHGCSKSGWLIPFVLILLGTLTSPLFAQSVDVLFYWDSSALIDEDGHVRAPAVAYKVFHQRDGGIERLIATVNDTTFMLQADPGVRHRIRVCGVDEEGRLGDVSEFSDEVYFEIQESGEMVPQTPDLRPNFPNPFNPETTIMYGVPENLPAGAVVAIEIFNIDGRRIRVLQPNTSPGYHSVSWDGRDDQGRVQPTGQYITRYTCGGQVRTSKMTMVK
jgi:hypothetical protein